MPGELIYRGAAKDVYRLDRDNLEIVFVDNLAVFGRRLDIQIPRKGALLCDAAASALAIAERAGVPHHLVERASDTSIIVTVGYPSADAAEFAGPIGAMAIECVSRDRVAGSCLTRLEDGQTFDQVDSPTYGALLRSPMVEFCARNAATTSYFTLPSAEGPASAATLRRMADASLAIDRCLAEALAPSGLVRADGKKEFAYDRAGNLMLVDCFATVEEDRIWLVNEEKIVSDVSLDPIRRHYTVGGSRDLSVGTPPAALIDQMFASYQLLAAGLQSCFTPKSP